jgi:hypothetical protein
VTPAKGGARARPADCFSCHAPHTLAAEGRPNPHPSR